MVVNEDSMKHGAFGWTELMTNNVEAAKQFYTSLFGWEIEEGPMEGSDYTVIKVDGSPVGGIMPMPPECTGMPECWNVYVTVQDVDAAAARVEELGGTLIRPPQDIPEVGRFCVLQDPNGAVICAITYVQK